MTDIIKKTAIVTIAVIFGVLILLAILLPICFPKFIADLEWNVGLEKQALKSSITQYERSGNFDDLVLVVDRGIYCQDYAVIDEYTFKLVSHSNFNEFCIKEDNKYQLSQSTSNYYKCKIVVANIELNKKDKAIKYAFDFLDGYEDGNTVQLLLSLAYRMQDNNFISDIESYFNSVKDSFNVDTQAKIQTDLNKIIK